MLLLARCVAIVRTIHFTKLGTHNVRVPRLAPGCHGAQLNGQGLSMLWGQNAIEC